MVAHRYDLATQCLSLGRDKAWKHCLIKQLPSHPAPACLDLACGSGDISAALAKRYPKGKIIGVDLTPAMLEQARMQHPCSTLTFMQQDMCAMTAIDNNSIDIITGGYALRNAPELNTALSEIHRVLKPGGIAAFLDFSKPTHRLGQMINCTLLKSWGSLWGILLHANPSIYAYIGHSLAQYPNRLQLKRLFEKNEFKIMKQIYFYFGLLELIIVTKP